MRTLEFKPDSPYYERLYWALVMSGQNLRDRGELALSTGIIRKLQGIGVVKPVIENNGTPRAHYRDELRLYITAGGSVVLDETEYDYCRRHCDAAIPIIHKSLAPELLATLEWLEGLEKWEPKPEAAAPAKEA